MKEERALTNIKLTEKNDGNIWLHFEANGLKACVSLEALVCMQEALLIPALASGTIAATVLNWARQQLDKQKVAHQRFYLEPPSNELLKEGQEQRTEVRGRPSPPKEGGY